MSARRPPGPLRSSLRSVISASLPLLLLAACKPKDEAPWTPATAESAAVAKAAPTAHAAPAAQAASSAAQGASSAAQAASAAQASAAQAAVVPAAIAASASAGAAASAAQAAGAASAGPAGSGPASAEPPKGEAQEAPAEKKISSGCYEQGPQEFLIRGTYYPAREHREAHARSVQYRAEHYGEIPKLTPPGLNAHTAQYNTQQTTFFGQTVQLHRKVIPALRCVERELVKACGGRYRPEVLAGWRPNNTYHQGELTNHLFGIAIDIDPHKNPCCHCIEPWNNHPRCADRKTTAYEHMAMPRCWVEVFERFGFYWLGHDRLEDTMHFEFLGDPDAVVPPPPKSKGKGKR